MTTKGKRKKAKKKPGPTEERLVIKGDPQVAIDKLLRKQPNKG